MKCGIILAVLLGLAFTVESLPNRGTYSLKRRSADVSIHHSAARLDADVSGEKFPSVLPMMLMMDDLEEPIQLMLTINERLTPSQIPVKVLDNVNLDQDEQNSLKDIAFYTENDHQGSFVVKAKNTEEGNFMHSAEGVLSVNGNRLIVQEAEDGVLRVKQSYENRPSVSESGGDDDEEAADLHADAIQFTIKKGGMHLTVSEKPHKARTGNRTKRSSPGETSFDIEILFVIDHTIYEYWLDALGNAKDAVNQITFLFSSYMNSMERAYASIDESRYGIKITPRLIGIDIITSSRNSSLTVNTITYDKKTPANDPFDRVMDTTMFFDEAAKWKEVHGLDWKNPDHLMVFTLYDVKNEGVVGVSLLGQICNGFNNIGFRGGLSIIEDNGFSTWTTMAHELAHNLGARHDGENGCPKEDMYIMTPVGSTYTSNTIDNAHEFSSCSINDMKETLLGTCSDQFCHVKTCGLDNKYVNVQQGAMTMFGEHISLDEQCRMAFGEGAKHYTRDNGDICLRLKCLQGQYIKTGMHFAADGTSCGHGKMCFEGHCVRKSGHVGPTKYSVKNTCSSVPQGCSDNKDFAMNFNKEHIDCNSVASKLPTLCWLYDSIAESCPATCHKVFCDTGDKSPCDQATSGSGSGSCEDNPNARFNGQNCGNFCRSLRNNGNLARMKRAYPSICERCCDSCDC